MYGSGVQASGVWVQQDDPICPVGGDVSQLPLLNGWMRSGNQKSHHSFHPIWQRRQEVHTRPAEPQNRTEAPTMHWKDGGGCWGLRVLTGATVPPDTLHLLCIYGCVCVCVCLKGIEIYIQKLVFLSNFCCFSETHPLHKPWVKPVCG